LDAVLPGLVVELVVRAAPRPSMRSQAAPPSGGDVLHGGWAGGLRLPRAGPFLVHGSRRDLLGSVVGDATLLVALLDVLVLSLALVAPRLPRHDRTPFQGGMRVLPMVR